MRVGVLFRERAVAGISEGARPVHAYTSLADAKQAAVNLDGHAGRPLDPDTHEPVFDLVWQTLPSGGQQALRGLNLDLPPDRQVTISYTVYELEVIS